MIKVINLKMNGNEFDPWTYTKNDNLEATLVSSNYEVATVRVTSLGETSVTLHSKREEASESFMCELGSIEGGDYDVVDYLISDYQEYKYPFTAEDDITDISEMLNWISNNLKIDDEICLYIAGSDLMERYIIIKHNKEGVSVDKYIDMNDEPFVEKTYWFEDYDDVNIVSFPTACGITADNTPNIVIENPRTNMPMTLWYYTSFNKKENALEFLKGTFKKGIKDNEIGLDSDEALWLGYEEEFNNKEA